MHLTGAMFWLVIDHDRSLQSTSPDNEVGQIGAASQKLVSPAALPLPQGRAVDRDTDYTHHPSHQI
jgi:hypothetical protein